MTDTPTTSATHEYGTPPSDATVAARAVTWIDSHGPEKPSRAAALRWLARHIGERVTTVQTRAADGRVWRPLPRTLSRKGQDSYLLDESRVSLDRSHHVTALDDDTLTIEWRDDEGMLIHTTVYGLFGSGYAWVIDSTKTTDDNDQVVEETDPEMTSNGTSGPHNAPAELLARLAAGEGRRWRTLYDVDYDGHPEDERVSHEGRYLDFADVHPEWATVVDAEAEHGPLGDFAAPDSGALIIQYLQDDGTWKTL